MELTIISLFAGCGGSSLGYKMAGFKELLAIEWENNAVETFKLNFPYIPIWQKNIITIDTQEVLKFCKIKKEDLDILDGSPPCQGFSTSGRRKVNDNRNNLFLEYIRFVKDLQPKVFIMENVSGMIKGKMKGKFIEIMQILQQLNYNVKCKLMNTKFYNVPQSRERLIFIGVRKNINKIPVYPEPNNKIITVKQALNNCNIGLTDGLFTKERLQLAKKIKQNKTGDCYKKGSSFNLRRLHWNKPSPTIIKMIGEPDKLFGGGLIHPEENRHLGIGELKRLQSFPDDFQFIGKFKEQWARIGNSVPPKFMEAIAKNIKDNIL